MPKKLKRNPNPPSPGPTGSGLELFRNRMSTPLEYRVLKPNKWGGRTCVAAFLRRADALRFMSPNSMFGTKSFGERQSQITITVHEEDSALGTHKVKRA